MAGLRFDEYGRTLYPATLDMTQSKPTLILDDKHKYTFNTSDEAHNWAAKHKWYIADYIEWEWMQWG